MATSRRGTAGVLQQEPRPPSARPLTREESREYALDIGERFYDDYRSRRTTGDAKNEVLTKVQKLPAFDPNLYKVNALRSLAYDPLRPVPHGLNFDDVLRKHTAVPGPRPSTSRQQRRMSDPGLGYIPNIEPLPEPLPPPVKPSGRPKSAMQKSMEATLNPTVIPAVEEWLTTASNKDREIAGKMFHTVSREGQREPSDSQLLKKTTKRIQSATSRRSEDQFVKNMYQSVNKQQFGAMKPLPELQQGKRMSRSKSESTATKGSMFGSSQRMQPAHYTIHPDWESEPRH